MSKEIKKIVHFCHLDKFIPPFIDFIEQHFSMEEHEFRIFGDIKQHPIKPRKNIIITAQGKIGELKAYYGLVIAMHKADKIILHSLFNQRMIKVLWAMPWLLKKCYWVMWGGDLYVYSLGKRDWNWNLCWRPIIFV